jgi:hypothetical protein
MTLHEPWKSFLHELDERLSGVTELHCFGGFVVAECYGLMRTTADVDFVQVRGADNANMLLKLAGKASPLAIKHKVYLDFVTIATVPEDYENRLLEIFSDQFQKLRLKAFEPHDLALAKLERNQDHDREDVKALSLKPGLDPNILRQRYKSEMRPNLGNPVREDLTLELWIEMIEETRRSVDRN